VESDRRKAEILDPASDLRRGCASQRQKVVLKISTHLKRAAAIASSFSLRVPLRQTVRWAVCNGFFLSVAAW